MFFSRSPDAWTLRRSPQDDGNWKPFERCVPEPPRLQQSPDKGCQGGEASTCSSTWLCTQTRARSNTESIVLCPTTLRWIVCLWTGSSVSNAPQPSAEKALPSGHGDRFKYRDLHSECCARQFSPSRVTGCMFASLWRNAFGAWGTLRLQSPKGFSILSKLCLMMPHACMGPSFVKASQRLHLSTACCGLKRTTT